MAANQFAGALRSFCRQAVILVAIALFSSNARGGGLPTLLYVDDDAPSGGLGETWATAFSSLQGGLDAAAALISGGGGPIEIRIGQGTYVPTNRTDLADPRSVTFQLMASLTLAGGFAGIGAGDPDQRDPAKHETTLSGYLADGSQAYHVMMAQSTSPRVVISGQCQGLPIHRQ